MYATMPTSESLLGVLSINGMNGINVLGGMRKCRNLMTNLLRTFVIWVQSIQQPPIITRPQNRPLGMKVFHLSKLYQNLLLHAAPLFSLPYAFVKHKLFVKTLSKIQSLVLRVCVQLSLYLIMSHSANSSHSAQCLLSYFSGVLS